MHFTRQKTAFDICSELLSPLPSSHCDLKGPLESKKEYECLLRITSCWQELVAVLISAPVFVSCSLFSYYTCNIGLSDLRHLLQGSVLHCWTSASSRLLGSACCFAQRSENHRGVAKAIEYNYFKSTSAKTISYMGGSVAAFVLLLVFLSVVLCFLPLLAMGDSFLGSVGGCRQSNSELQQ